MGAPEPDFNFSKVQQLSANVVLAQCLKFEIVKSASGQVVERYYLGEEQVFKGSALNSPVDVLPSNSDPEPDNYHYVCTKNDCVLLCLLSDSSGTFHYAGLSFAQRHLELTIDRPVNSFPDTASLAIYLLDSNASSNHKAGLALAVGLSSTPSLKSSLNRLVTRGSPREQYLANIVLQHTKNSDEDTTLPKIQTEIESWRSKWNNSDLDGMLSMIDRGSPPYLGERSDAHVKAALTNYLREGPISKISILQKKITTASAEISLRYSFKGGKESQGSMILHAASDGNFLIRSFEIH